MKSTKLLETHHPVSVMVAPMAADETTDEPRVYKTTAELIELAKLLPGTSLTYSELREFHDSIVDTRLNSKYFDE